LAEKVPLVIEIMENSIRGHFFTGHLYTQC